MPFTPDLSKLENDYQILTELHHTDESYTVLARHLVLNRDVTITVVRGENVAALRELAADAIRLTAVRQPNIIPVVEGRWLDEQTFALVRARVRGSTLDQVAGAVGGMPLPRVAAALRQVNDALVWSRENGIAHRHVLPEDVVFQQGSGRVLVGFLPLVSVLHGVQALDQLNPCADAHTIGELAYTMLSGSPPVGTARSLAETRPDLSPAIVDGVQRLLRCTPADRAVNIDSFLALLGPAAVDAASVTVAPPTGSAPAVIVTQRNGMSFGARLAMAVLVLVVIAIGAYALVHKRNDDARSRVASNALPADDGNAEGDVALHANRNDSTPQAVPSPITSTPTIVSPPATAMPATIDTAHANPNAAVGAYPPPYPSPYPSQAQPAQPVMPPSPYPPPAARRHEPAVPVNPPVIAPSAPVDTSVVSTGDVCASPAARDQQQCLMAAVARNDRTLTDVYQRLIDALRRQANVQPGDADPPAVASLRSDERRWLETRDEQCHNTGSGPLYARDRAACFADQTNARVSELQQRLDAIGTAKPDSVATDSIHAHP